MFYKNKRSGEVEFYIHYEKRKYAYLILVFFILIISSLFFVNICDAYENIILDKTPPYTGSFKSGQIVDKEGFGYGYSYCPIANSITGKIEVGEICRTFPSSEKMDLYYYDSSGATFPVKLPIPSTNINYYIHSSSAVVGCGNGIYQDFYAPSDGWYEVTIYTTVVGKYIASYFRFPSLFIKELLNSQISLSLKAKLVGPVNKEFIIFQAGSEITNLNDLQQDAAQHFVISLFGIAIDAITSSPIGTILAKGVEYYLLSSKNKNQ